MPVVNHFQAILDILESAEAEGGAMPTMRFNLDLRSEDMVAIRLTRPTAWATERALREQDAPILPPPTPMTFSRGEWAVLVNSGLLHALGLWLSDGWRDWDEATVFRAQEVTEKDHLLVVASLFLRGHDFYDRRDGPYPPGLVRAGMAMARLAAAAAVYREREHIEGPPPTVSYFHEGRLWLAGLGSRIGLPDPSFEAPLLEQAVEETHVETLVDLAKHGEEATFRELAQTLGVPAEKLDELWAGTVRRVKP